MFLPLQTDEEVEEEEDLSDDELPPDVDLSDPFFAEELAGAGDHMAHSQPTNQNPMSLRASCCFLFWSSPSSVVLGAKTRRLLLLSFFSQYQ